MERLNDKSAMMGLFIREEWLNCLYFLSGSSHTEMWSRLCWTFHIEKNIEYGGGSNKANSTWGVF